MDLELFADDEFSIRYRDEPDGEDGTTRWFLLADVITALGQGNPSTAVKSLDDDEKRQFDPREAIGEKYPQPQEDTSQGAGGGRPTAWFVTEPGVYGVCIRSRSPRAIPFRRWVTHKVLPALNHTGTYSMPSVRPVAEHVIPQTYGAALLAAAQLAIELENTQAELTAAQPMIDVYRDVIEAPHGAVTMQAASNMLQWGNRGRTTLMAKLRDEGILQSFGPGHNTPYARYMKDARGRDLFTMKLSSYQHPRTGAITPTVSTLVTPLGIAWLCRRLKATLTDQGRLFAGDDDGTADAADDGTGQE